MINEILLSMIDQSSVPSKYQPSISMETVFSFSTAIGNQQRREEHTDKSDGHICVSSTRFDDDKTRDGESHSDKAEEEYTIDADLDGSP
jgi:hypothetical protein